MKKLLLSAALTLATVVTYGQGTINFSNATSAWGTASADYLLRFGPSARMFDSRLVDGSLVSSNSGGVDLSTLRAELLYGASTITSLHNLSEANPSGPAGYATFRASTAANAGAWFGSMRTFNGLGGTFYPGDTVSLGIIVWDTRYAATGLEVLYSYEHWTNSTYAGLAAFTSVFQYTIPTGSIAPTELLPQFTPFTLEITPIPEPATLALVGLGAAALFLRRWRKD